MRRTGLATALSALQKVLPDLLEHDTENRLQSFVLEAMKNHDDLERITIEINPHNREWLEKIIEDSQGSGEPTVNIRENEKLPSGDCRVLWAEGGIELMAQRYKDDMINALEQVTATVNPDDQTVPSESTEIDPAADSTIDNSTIDKERSAPKTTSPKTTTETEDTLSAEKNEEKDAHNTTADIPLEMEVDHE